MNSANTYLVGLLSALLAPTAHAQSPPAMVTGDWGGAHIRVVLTESGGRVEYDCASGTIDEPLRPDAQGRFDVRGTYVAERGGPVRRGEPTPTSQRARYRGWTDGTAMRLTASVLDTGADVGTFSLDRGRPALLEKCL